MNPREVLPPGARALCCSDLETPSGAAFLQWQHQCSRSALASPSNPSRLLLEALGKGPRHGLGAPGLSPRMGIPHCSGLLSQGTFYPPLRLFLNPVPPCAAAAQLLHNPVIDSVILVVIPLFLGSHPAFLGHHIDSNCFTGTLRIFDFPSLPGALGRPRHVLVCEASSTFTSLYQYLGVGTELFISFSSSKACILREHPVASQLLFGFPQHFNNNNVISQQSR